MGLISIRISFEGGWVHHSFVEHELIAFVFRIGVKFIVSGVTHNLVRFDDLSLSGFVQRFLNFIQNILTHDIIV